ncbi:hypothetical protein MNV49_003020 [Pseudohyphozyma bogoriensis]|nr:hypothetical protein MNV49_003020 [Pseudohyphozyma bogoriensis]
MATTADDAQPDTTSTPPPAATSHDFAQSSHEADEGAAPPKREDAYDYRNSTIDDDRKAAEQVEKRMLERLNERDDSPSGDQQDCEQDAAAKLVQSSYRTHRSRREQRGMNLSSSQRWNDGLLHDKISKAGKDQDGGKNDSASRWKRTGLYTAQVAGAHDKDPDDGQMTEEEEMDLHATNDKEREKIKKERKASKAMEAQYWLEIVDSKHRYGTNLKWYHRHWNEQADTTDNFFHWLDEGAGKDLDLEQCPRSRLDKERIAYLTAEQRRNYLVQVNDKGELVWARNGEKLDTTKEYKDGGPETGIVKMTPEEMEQRKKEQQERRRRAKGGEETSSSSSSSSSSDEEDPEEGREGVKGYSDKGGTAGQGKGAKQFKARVHYYLSPRAVMDRLLRETINKNTWLYVADLRNNLYVGIKQTGAFQHSSFLFGARVTSAGLIKVSNGKLTSLSPLSGHYRAGTVHFKSFIRSLEEEGCDMSSLSVSKSLATIGGIEKYAKVMKKKKHFTETVKSKLGIAKPEAEQQKEQDKSDADGIKKSYQQDGKKHGDEEAYPDDDRLEGPLPHDGKKVEEMTEEERMERGVALIHRAIDRMAVQRSKEADRRIKDTCENDTKKAKEEEVKEDEEEKRQGAGENRK